MRNIFAYLATASVVSVSAPLSAESSELKLFQRLVTFHEQLLTSEEKRTSPKGLASLMNQAKNGSQETRTMYAKALTFAELLERASSREEQEFLYAEISSTLKDLAPKFAFHAFYCPQTGKTWIARGSSIRNPFIFEAQYSGEIIN